MAKKFLIKVFLKLKKSKLFKRKVKTNALFQIKKQNSLDLILAFHQKKFIFFF